MTASLVAPLLKPCNSSFEPMAISQNDKQILGQWLEQQRAKPQFRPAPSAGMAVNRVMRPLAKHHGKGRSAITLAPIWPEIMGPKWSKISTPVRFLGGKSGRTLIISAPGAAAALIMAASQLIIERLNAHLGANYVTRIKIVQTHMGSKLSQKPYNYTHRHSQSQGLSPRQMLSLEKDLSQFNDGPLKSALEKLGKSVLKTDNNKNDKD